MADAVYDFLSSGGEIPKSSSMQKPMAQAAATPDYSTSEDPVHDFLASGGHNIGDVSKDSRGYFRRVKDAALEFQNAVNSENKITTAPKAVGEMALAMTTGGLVPVAKHAIAEGAYLAGESPTTGKVIADEIIPKACMSRRARREKHLQTWWALSRSHWSMPGSGLCKRLDCLKRRRMLLATSLRSLFRRLSAVPSNP
jgi:hypothetical protein